MLLDTQLTGLSELLGGTEHPVLAILLGIAAGYVAAKLMSGREQSNFGVIVNCVIGVLGSLLAGWLCPKIGISFTDAWYGSFLQSLIGAIIILAVINKLKR